jgi:integrase
VGFPRRQDSHQPAADLERFAGSVKKRGVLTETEVETIFSKVIWDDKRAYIANLTACTTGLRLGEVLALRRSVIGDDTLDVSYSWSCIDGLKRPEKY